MFEKQIEIYPVPVSYFLPNGEKVNEETLNIKLARGEVDYGVFRSNTPGIGDMFSIAMPPHEGMNETDQKELTKVLMVLNNLMIGNFSKQESTEIFKTAFKNSPFLKFYLLDMMLPSGSLYIKQNVLHKKLQHIPENLKKELFDVLTDSGMKYEHLIVHPNIDVASLSFCFDFLGCGRLNTICGMPFLMTLFMGKGQVMHFEKVKLAIEKGIDVNAQHEAHGTILHHLIANEFPEEVCEEIVKLLNETDFNYILQDAEGKTPLLLAAKLNKTGIAKQLFKLHKQKIDVGIDVPDHEGRTPLLISATLGNVELFELLLTLNVDTNVLDKQGRDLDFYINASEEMVRDLLLSIHVQPERDIRAPHNWLYFNDQLSRPLACSESKDPEKRVLISKETEHWNLVKQICRTTKKKNLDLFNHIEMQISFLKEGNSCTMLQSCLAGKEAVQKCIKEYQLRWACALGQVEIVEKLLNEGINPNSVDNLKRTALHYSVMRIELIKKIPGSPKTVEELEECVSRHIEILRLLLNTENIQIDVKNQNGNTPLGIIKREAGDLNQETTSQDQKIARALLKIMDEIPLKEEITTTNVVFN